MGKSKIEWTTYTFNPWTGCSKIGEGCRNCYAETYARRWGLEWGVNARREVMSEAYWRQPLSWDRSAERHRRIQTVFCGSLCDVFEHAPHSVLNSERTQLWRLIDATPHLYWLLLTKRPVNIPYMTPDSWKALPPGNVGFGVSAWNELSAVAMWSTLAGMLREAFVRQPSLKFISLEPLLGHVDIQTLCDATDEVPDWIIVGGESGRRARPFDLSWGMEIIETCTRLGVPVFIKQIGTNSVYRGEKYIVKGKRDYKGGDPSQWPDELQVRQFPQILEEVL